MSSTMKQSKTLDSLDLEVSLDDSAWLATCDRLGALALSLASSRPVPEDDAAAEEAASGGEAGGEAGGDAAGAATSAPPAAGAVPALATTAAAGCLLSLLGVREALGGLALTHGSIFVKLAGAAKAQGQALLPDRKSVV